MKPLYLSHLPRKNTGISAPQNTPVRSFSEWEMRLGPAISLSEKQRIYHLLAILLRSGLGIMDSITVVAEQASTKDIRQILTHICDELAGGKPLSSSLEAQAKVFSSFEVHSLHMGEQTGRMVEVLDNLAIFFDKKVKLRRKIIQALSYPAAVVGISFLVLSFMLAFVVPMFRDIFRQFDAKLPAITEWVINIAGFFGSGGWLLFVAAAIAGLCGFFLREKLWMKKLSAAASGQIPLLGSLILKLHLSRFAYSLGMLLSAKVSLDQALFLTGEMMSYYPIQQAAQNIRKVVVEGGTLYDAVRQTHVFPVFFVQIIRVGEQTARLDEMMNQLAMTMEEETERVIQQLTQFIEPLLIVVLGGMVAWILVAMYLPMFELGNAIG
ncbi:MAG: type II secretion system F family protein [Bacteroidia bacterium]